MKCVQNKLNCLGSLPNDGTTKLWHSNQRKQFISLTQTFNNFIQLFTLSDTQHIYLCSRALVLRFRGITVWVQYPWKDFMHFLSFLYANSPKIRFNLLKGSKSLKTKVEFEKVWRSYLNNRALSLGFECVPEVTAFWDHTCRYECTRIHLVLHR